MVDIIDGVLNLVSEYEKKIENCDTLLSEVSVEIKILRKTNEDCSLERNEQSVLNAKRQSYIQAKVDLESLLDYV